MIINFKHLFFILVTTTILTFLLFPCTADIDYGTFWLATGCMVVMLGYIPYLFIGRDYLANLPKYRTVPRRHVSINASGYSPQRRVYLLWWTFDMGPGQLWFSDKVTCEYWIRKEIRERS